MGHCIVLLVGFIVEPFGLTVNTTGLTDSDVDFNVYKIREIA